MPRTFRAQRRDSGRTVGFGKANTRARRTWHALPIVTFIALLGAGGCSQELVAVRPAGTGGAGNCLFNSCSRNDQCCDGMRCAINVCVPNDAGACGYYGQDCENDNSCCNSSPCEATRQGQSHVCVNPWCQREGGPCQYSLECCGLSCEGGICTQGRPCGVRNDKCTSNADCCSTECNSGNCDNSSSCAVIGDSCTFQKDCCSGSCVNSRCMMNNACRNIGEVCNDKSQCCTNKCSSSSHCEAGCVFLAEFCQQDEDCCSNYCVPSASGQGPGNCSCMPKGQSCALDKNCCSNQCADDGTGQMKCN